MPSRPRSSTTPRSEPITAAAPAPLDAGHRRGHPLAHRRHRQVAQGERGGVGGVRRAGRARLSRRRAWTIFCTCSLAAPPHPATASLTWLGLYWATSQPAAAASARASPLAWPTLIAVRTLTWKKTCSTATASGWNSAISAASSSAQGGQPLRQRVAGRRADDPERRPPWPRPGPGRRSRRSRTGSARDRSRAPGSRWTRRTQVRRIVAPGRPAVDRRATVAACRRAPTRHAAVENELVRYKEASTPTSSLTGRYVRPAMARWA